MKVNEIASRQVWSCQLDTDLARLGRMMQEGDFGFVPVVEEARRVIGVITDRDVCLALAASEEPACDMTVRQASTRTVFTCSPEDDVRDALRIMKDNRVRRLPVIDQDGTLRGIVSLDDVALVARPSAGADRGPTLAEVGATLQAISGRRLLTPEVTKH